MQHIEIGVNEWISWHCIYVCCRQDTCLRVHLPGICAVTEPDELLDKS